MIYHVWASSLHANVASTINSFKKLSRNFVSVSVSESKGSSLCHRLETENTAASPFSRKCIHITWFTGTTSLLPFHLHIQANYTPWITQQLVSALHQQRDRIRAVVYCRRFGTADIFNQMPTTDVLIIRADKHLLPHRKRTTPEYERN